MNLKYGITYRFYLEPILSVSGLQPFLVGIIVNKCGGAAG